MFFVEEKKESAYLFRQKGYAFLCYDDSKMEVDKMMDLVERKDTKTEGKLPKNIRQIGEPGTGTKVFIEDYAYTYLHQLAEENLTSMKTAVLVGDAKEGVQDLYSGRAGTGYGTGNQKLVFPMNTGGRYFGRSTNGMKGWMWWGGFCLIPGFPPVLTEEMKTLHLRNFSGDRYVFFQMDVLDNEEIFYAGSASDLRLLAVIIYNMKEMIPCRPI